MYPLAGDLYTHQDIVHYWLSFSSCHVTLPFLPGENPILSTSSIPVNTIAVAPGATEVSIRLPPVPTDKQDSAFSYRVEWRRVGDSTWQSTSAASSADAVTLPGRLLDGNYEVRVTLLSRDGSVLVTAPQRFTLQALGKQCDNLTPDFFSVQFIK